METLYHEVLPWLARLYDAASGGFYESLATRLRPGSGPDIQSSAMALAMLDDNGALRDAPPAVKARMVTYFQSRQNAQTGMFVDPDYPQMSGDERIMARALAFAKTGLQRLGANPLYPLAGAPDNEVPPRFRSADDLQGWLEARDWDNPWQALGDISAQKAVLRLLPAPQREPLARQIYDYALARQDARTGFIGGGATIAQISGMAKFGWFCVAYDLPIPRADALYASVMAWLRTEPQVSDLTMVRNVVHHLVDLQPLLSEPMPDADKELLMFQTVRLMQPFRQADGAFSMQHQHFRLRPNDLWPPLGQSEHPQSDVNGTSQAHVIRQKFYELRGQSAPPIADAAEFWQLIPA